MRFHGHSQAVERQLIRVLLVAAAVPLVALSFATKARAAVGDFGIASAGASLSTTEAGAHPDFSTTIVFKTDPASPADAFGRKEPYAQVKNIGVDLPPGLIGDPTTVATCTLLQFSEGEFAKTADEFAGCSLASQVGVAVIERYTASQAPALVVPIYNLEAPGGDTVARLGLSILGVQVFIDASVRSEGDYGVSATSTGLSSTGGFTSLTTTLWGVPADSSHNTQRLTPVEASQGTTKSPPRSSGLSPAPFMTNPTRCGVPLHVGFGVTSYQTPDEQVSTASASLPEITDCGKLKFNPSLTVTPTTRDAASPSGLEASLVIPQNEAFDGRATSQLRYATVTLPEGVTIASGAADGLQACSGEEVGLGTRKPAACPEAAKIGTAEFDVPALARTLQGSIYQRTPVAGNLFGIWLVADDLGVHVKIPGEVHPDPKTGQLTASFEGTAQTEGNPQVPLREFKLHFKGGPRGVLAMPDRCGSYLTHYEFVPWSGSGPVSGDTPMTIDRNCDTGGFSPRFSAGTRNPTAGAFSPVVTNLTRESGEQNVSGLDVTLPPGVLAKIAGVPLCDEAAAEVGSCPSTSQVGTTTVAAGPGSSPLWIPQPGKDPTAVYLAGPYAGAPYSLVVRTPAQAGPFDLGTVVVRAAVRLNPDTAQVTVKSDPLPQILEGVPISYRTIHVDIDKPEFTVNPTSCDPMEIRAAATSEEGSVAALSDRFQAAGCASLPFKPNLQMRLLGRTRRGGHPSLRAVLKARPGDANIAAAVVALPRSEFLDQAHINTVCTRVQFGAGACPAGSVYGHASAVSPLLDQPLEGPVYLRSSSNKLPDLVVALKGPPSQPIEIDLVGRIDSVRGGIRTTFATVPDAPVSRFELAMQGGKKGLLVNSRDICQHRFRADVRMDGQNGKAEDLRPVLRSPRCTG